MSPTELRGALKLTTNWDERVQFMGACWRAQLKKYHAQPDKLYWAWEEIMSIYHEEGGGTDGGS